MQIKVELVSESAMEYEAASLITVAVPGEIMMDPTIPCNTFTIAGVDFDRALDLLHAIQQVLAMAQVKQMTKER